MRRRHIFWLVFSHTFVAAVVWLAVTGGESATSGIKPGDTVTIGYQNRTGQQRTATVHVQSVANDASVSTLDGFYLSVVGEDVPRRVFRFRTPSAWPD